MTHELKINETLERLESKAVTHPNIVLFWKQYISRKIDMLNNSLLECDCVIESLTAEQVDIETESLVMAYFFTRALRSNAPLEE